MSSNLLTLQALAHSDAWLSIHNDNDGTEYLIASEAPSKCLQFIYLLMGYESTSLKNIHRVALTALQTLSSASTISDENQTLFESASTNLRHLQAKLVDSMEAHESYWVFWLFPSLKERYVSDFSDCTNIISNMSEVDIVTTTAVRSSSRSPVIETHSSIFNRYHERLTAQTEELRSYITLLDVQYTNSTALSASISPLAPNPSLESLTELLPAPNTYRKFQETFGKFQRLNRNITRITRALSRERHISDAERSTLEEQLNLIHSINCSLPASAGREIETQRSDFQNLFIQTSTDHVKECVSRGCDVHCPPSDKASMISEVRGIISSYKSQLELFNPTPSSIHRYRTTLVQLASPLIDARPQNTRSAQSIHIPRLRAGAASHWSQRAARFTGRSYSNSPSTSSRSRFNSRHIGALTRRTPDIQGIVNNADDCFLNTLLQLLNVTHRDLFTQRDATIQAAIVLRELTAHIQRKIETEDLSTAILGKLTELYEGLNQADANPQELIAAAVIDGDSDWDALRTALEAKRVELVERQTELNNIRRQVLEVLNIINDPSHAAISSESHRAFRELIESLHIVPRTGHQDFTEAFNGLIGNHLFGYEADLAVSPHSIHIRRSYTNPVFVEGLPDSVTLDSSAAQFVDGRQSSDLAPELSLDIPSGVESLRNHLRSIFSPEGTSQSFLNTEAQSVNGQYNSFRDEDGVVHALSSATETYELLSLPETFSFNIMRWVNTDGRIRHLTNPVNMEGTFTITDINGNRADYELQAISIHTGGITGGHYQGVFFSPDGAENAHWTYVSDGRVISFVAEEDHHEANHALISQSNTILDSARRNGYFYVYKQTSYTAADDIPAATTARPTIDVEAAEAVADL